MQQDSLPELSKKRECGSHGHSFTALPSDLAPVLRSYSEIRKQMHLSLQARLNRDYLRKNASFPPKTEISIREHRKLWETLQKTAISASISHIKIEAKLKTLARRDNAFKSKLFSGSFDSSEASKPQRNAAFLSQYPAVSIKEAMKDREWLSRNRDSLQKSIMQIVNDSNGVKLVSLESPEPFRYFIRKGNNSSLVNQIMKTRPWWVRVKSKSEAHFVWSVKREESFFTLIPCGVARTGSRLDTARVSLSYASKFCPADSKVARLVNTKPLGFTLITHSPSYTRLATGSLVDPRSLRIHNKLEGSAQLTNKKALYWNLKRYYAAIGEDYTQYLPLTFHIANGETDMEFAEFMRSFAEREEAIAKEDDSLSRNLWIVKPGENSNQGREITVCSSLDQVRQRLRSVSKHRCTFHTFVVQQYIDRPFLYYRRKFDIRCYTLVTSVNGVVQAYFFPEGYLRTSSKEFSLKHIGDKYIHLTNDAVQKTSDDYGKFEYGNKISYQDFQKYLDSHCPELKVSFTEQILPQIKRLVQDSIKATFLKLDPRRRNHSFEIMGYDIMLDSRLKPILIEANTNPCLALVSPLLFRIIPTMVDSAFRLALDCLFPDCSGKKSFEPIAENRWELIFHELVDGKALLRALQDRGIAHMLDYADEMGCLDTHSNDDDSVG